MSDGIEIYFDLCHRQPIWCFNREDLEASEEISTELAYSMLELTARFMQQQDKLEYGEHAKWSIMLRVANGTVELETIESLCLLSYSAFIGMSCRIPFHPLSVADTMKTETCILVNSISVLAFSYVDPPA
jgi:hypothetical protein